MTPQSSFMIVDTIRESLLEDLRELLASMNNEIGRVNPDNDLVPFNQLDRLHTGRFVIIEAHTTDETREFGVTPAPWQPTLAFMGDIDGDRETFFADLVRHAKPGLVAIFSHCVSYSDKKSDLLHWMQSHNLQPDVNYINYLGRTVKQIREEIALHNSLAQRLDAIMAEEEQLDSLDLRQKLLSHVELEKHAGRLILSPPEPTPLNYRIRKLVHLIGFPFVLLLSTPFFLLLAPFYIIRLRKLETTDPELFIRPDREYIKSLSLQEDHDITNQYNVFGDVKPGFLRLFTFKFVFLILDYFTRHIYNRGFLSRIRTIHFARWVFMDNNRRVFFASTYDGSHESYMDDFINKVGWGLNLSFSSGVGYPTTSWLIKQGANREMQFKYTQRRHQIGSEVWYKAYPGVTAVDMHRNSRIRQGVENRPPTLKAIREWLSLI